MDTNTKTQEQARDAFISREIYACQSGLIEEALKKELFSMDEIDNLYGSFDGTHFSPAICTRCNNAFVLLDSQTGECLECFNDYQEPQEIFEWWLVSRWFGKKLLIEGEPIIDNGYGIWWGRTTTGQAISMDVVIQRIYDDLVSYTG